MVRSLIRTAVALSAGALFAGAAQSADLYHIDSTPETASPGSFTADFSSPAAGQAMLSFSLIGYNSLDGDNGFIDVFTLSLNNAVVLSGTFNMSGGGTSYLIVEPDGTLWNTVTKTCDACQAPNYLGGSTTISVPITVTAGSNSLVFGYQSPTSFGTPPTARTGVQGIGDESWSLSNVTVAAVPEPETYAMMLAGLGLFGALGRRRKIG